MIRPLFKPREIPMPEMDIVTYELTRAGFKSMEVQERRKNIINFKKDNHNILSVDLENKIFWAHDGWDCPRAIDVRTLRAIIRLYKELGWLKDENY